MSNMIKDLKSDVIINQMGGRFKLTALIQRRWHQIVQGARPMVETKGLSDIEVVVREIVEGKIDAIMPDDLDESDDA
jgi:DNA-directed RNA polymerase subunit omega